MKINEAFYLRHETWGSIQNWLLAKYLPVTIWNSYNMGLINLWVEGLLSVSWVNISERAKLVTPDLLSQRNHLGPLLRMLLFSHRVMSDSLRSHGLQHARLPCPSPSPGVCSDSCPLSRWGRPTIYLILCCPLLLLPPIFPSIRSLPVTWLFASGGQSIGASAWRASQRLSRLRICLQCRRHRRRAFNSWVRKIPWRRKMATHSNILGRKVPWTEEPGRLQPKGSKRVRHAWTTKHMAQKSC